jgi:hypothetical protein
VTVPEAYPAAPHSFAEDDREHLRLLSIFHFVVAGFIALASLVPAAQIAFGLLMAAGYIERQDEGAAIFGWFLASCASFFFLIGVAAAVMIARAGQSIAQRRHHTYCLAVAGILCLVVPFGTVLGVLSLVVLVKPSVRALFV